MSSPTCQDCIPPKGDEDQPTPSNLTEASTSTSTMENKPVVQEEILPPNVGTIHPLVLIEFCDRCRWAPRATWIQTELFLTFPSPLIRGITLLPLNTPETGGRFRVWLDLGNGFELVWDRKSEGGFPELKVLKQRIRNLVQPELSLGHSDVHSTKGHRSATSTV